MVKKMVKTKLLKLCKNILSKEKEVIVRKDDILNIDVEMSGYINHVTTATIKILLRGDNLINFMDITSDLTITIKGENSDYIKSK